MNKRDKSNKVQSPNVWGNVQPPQARPKPAKNHPNTEIKSNPAKNQEKFKQVQAKHLEAASKHIKDYESSSDEEEITAGDDILKTVFQSYAGNSADLSKTQQFLENLFQSGSATCLICIGGVKRADAIWSCEKCYTFFHLQCIQRWSNDSVSLKQMNISSSDQGYYNNMGIYVPKKSKPILWDCPKCRTTYSPEEIPRNYICFCGKEVSPTNHLWNIPHSCGESCGKPLKPECGHKCVLLCHPGPCPPCPQIISVSCKCGNSAPRTVRCTQKSWTCNKKCNLKLGCGIHECELICHDKNDCPPCKRKSKQRCVCGFSFEERNCSQSGWKCKKVCNKMFLCGLHKCEKICHINDCGNCPYGEPRSCPCGKQFSVAPCSEQVESCGDTCQKTLPCDVHYCALRCHKGDCSPCSTIVEKKCRCGLHSKELPCSKTFTCESKCKQIRECKKHPCNRKCCDNQCPPCDKICGKTLSCTKHKCQSLCHNGPCYPCNQKSIIKCRCGSTTKDVPCGRERKTPSPKCMMPCKIPSKCHHDNPHRCHQNDCPICIQMCNLYNDTTGCDHPCENRCHDAVKVLITDKNFKPALPWEVQVEIYEVRKLPHPACQIKVAAICLGGHEECLWPCYNSKPTSCQRKCGRKLKCGNHQCQRLCHEVKDLKSTEQEETCQPCAEGCIIARSDGCIHPCKRACHPPPCDPCNANIKTQCHCGLSQVFYKCGQFFRPIKDEEDRMQLADEKEKIMSCGNRCNRNYPCGHQCRASCHSGKCPNPEQCKKKIKLYCQCKNLRQEVTCEKIRMENFQMRCNETCTAKKQELREAAKQKETELKKQEEERNRIELEEFEKKYSKKKPRERKTVVVEDQEDRNLAKIGLIVASGLVLISFVVYLFTK